VAGSVRERRIGNAILGGWSAATVPQNRSERSARAKWILRSASGFNSIQ
jgi:hypothetical protein